MKKLLSWALVLALFLSLSLAGGWSGLALAEVPADRVGSYDLIRLEIDGVDYTQLILDSGVVFNLVLKEDGTAVLTTADDVMEVRWDESCFEYDNGERSPYSYDNGVITLEEDDTLMVFQRSDGSGTKTADAGEESIVGTWVGTVDITEYLLEDSPDLAPFLKFTPVDVTMEMRADGSYTMDVDATAAIPYLKLALHDYILDVCAANGISLEDFEATAGKTADALIEESVAEADLSGAVQQGNGTYTEENGKVVWDPGADEMVGLFSGDLLTFSIEGFGNAVLTRGGAVGTWVGIVDIRDSLVEELEEIAPYLKTVPVYLTMELKEDGSYTITMDGAGMIPAFREALRSYINGACEENGITVEQFEESIGASVDAFLDESLGALDVSEFSEETEGDYTVSGQRLVLDPGSGETAGSFDDKTIKLDLDEYGEVVFTRAGFVGTWSGMLEISEYLLEEVPDLADYLKEAKAEITLELHADGSYTISMDAAPMLPALKDAMRAYLLDEAQKQGLSAEQMEQSLGMSLDDYLDDLLAEMDLNEMNVQESGSFRARGGKILLDESSASATEGIWHGSSLILETDELGTVVLTRR